MDPLTIGLLAGIPSLALGTYQAIKGYQLGNQERPEYEIPDSLKQMLGMAKTQASQTGLPGQSLLEQNIRGTTSRGANILERSTQGSQLLGGISDLVTGEQQQMANIGIAGEQQNITNQQNLQNALSTYAQYEDKAYEINELQPYLQAMQQAQALTSAGIQNIVGGIGGGLGAGMQSQMNTDYLDLLKSMYGSTMGGTKTTNASSSNISPNAFSINPAQIPKLQGIGYLPANIVDFLRD